VVPLKERLGDAFPESVAPDNPRIPQDPSVKCPMINPRKRDTDGRVVRPVSEGELRLDHTVQRRLPGVVPNGSKITIRQLLNHTSGLSDFESDARYLKPYLAGNLAYYWSPRQLVRMGISHKPLFAPGRGWSYSNTNYVVAQLIVERLTRRTIGGELERRIFQPLHLRQTSYPTKPGLPRPYVHGYMLLTQPPLTDVTGLSPRWRADRAASSPQSETSRTSTAPCSPECCSSRPSCRR
jgi:CubicO group peptidase (beta-lactamase class C family)